MKIVSVGNSIWMVYEKLVMLGLIVLLAGTFCFGRAFSILDLGMIGPVPLYVTDVFIVLSLPFAFFAFKDLLQLSKWFFIPYCLMFMMGAGYLFWETVFAHNSFALRGVVLSTYLLFIPVVLRMSRDFKRWDLFLAGMIMCNAVGIVIGWYIVPHTSQFLRDVFVVHARGFNLALFYCMGFAFLWAYAVECKTRFGIVAAGFLAILNSYWVLVFSVRSSWVAWLLLISFYGIILYRQWKRAGFFLLTVVIAVAGMTYSINGVNTATVSYIEKIAGLRYFFKMSFVCQRSRQDVVMSTVVLPGEQAARSESRISGYSVIAEEPSKNIEIRLAKKGPAASSLAPMSYGNIYWRFIVWRKAWKEIRSAFLFGKGLGAVLPYDGEIQCKRISGFAKDSGIVPLHNEILTILYKMGGVGLLLFLWINGFVFVAGCRRVNVLSGIKRVVLVGMLGSFIVWHVMAQFFDLIDSPPTNIFLWVMMGCILALSVCKDEQC